jgi:hypothetical protein
MKFKNEIVDILIVCKLLVSFAVPAQRTLVFRLGGDRCS